MCLKLMLRKRIQLILSGRALYVIEIGDSPLAPHQSKSDHVYYGRVSGKSRPLGNRMVLDRLIAGNFQTLYIKFYFASIDDNDPYLLRREGKHKVLSLQITNNGPVHAQYVNCIIFIQENLIDPDAIRTILQGYPVRLEDGLPYIRLIRKMCLPKIFSSMGEYKVGVQGAIPQFFRVVQLSGTFH